MDARIKYRLSRMVALLSAFQLIAPTSLVEDRAQAQTPSPDSTVEAVAGNPEEAPKLPKDQLNSLVAPIALYPDPLLAQALAASTYPLELVQLQQWLSQHKD